METSYKILCRLSPFQHTPHHGTGDRRSVTRPGGTGLAEVFVVGGLCRPRRAAGPVPLHRGNQLQTLLASLARAKGEVRDVPRATFEDNRRKIIPTSREDHC